MSCSHSLVTTGDAQLDASKVEDFWISKVAKYEDNSSQNGNNVFLNISNKYFSIVNKLFCNIPS